MCFQPLHYANVNTNFGLLSLATALAVAVPPAYSQPADGTPQALTATVSVQGPGKAISSDLIGVFFEDINYAADGGLYAELVQNRSFEYSNVVYVASRPPHSYTRNIAERFQRQIVYIPIGAISPTRLKQIRVFHILSGHDKRDIARDYIL